MANDPLPSIWTGFYKKTLEERLAQLKLVYPGLDPLPDLPLDIADNMIENCIGHFSLPLGLGLNFVINGKSMIIPMVTEESSVVASISGAAKTISEIGSGFKTCSTQNTIISQIQILNVSNPVEAIGRIEKAREELIQKGNQYCQNMVRRGGGIVDIQVRNIPYSESKYFGICTAEFEGINRGIEMEGCQEKGNIIGDLSINSSCSSSSPCSSLLPSENRDLIGNLIPAYSQAGNLSKNPSEDLSINSSQCPSLSSCSTSCSSLLPFTTTELIGNSIQSYSQAGDLSTNPSGDLSRNPSGDLSRNPSGDLSTNPFTLTSTSIDSIPSYSQLQYFSKNTTQHLTTPFEQMIVVHLLINTCESMGANLASTLAESLAPHLLNLIGSGRLGLRVLSNHSFSRRAKASFCVPIDRLQYKDRSGLDVARGILEAYMMACEDPYRTATHNKGVMNGIDAVAIATGQDWRAIEASAHAWSFKNQKYEPLTHYGLVFKPETSLSIPQLPLQLNHFLTSFPTHSLYLYGWCELPTPVGVCGGSIKVHPTTCYTHAILGFPTSRQLGEILCAVGLAQNFAALRSLSTEGIQRGHMSLHSRNISIQAGSPPDLIPQVSAYLISCGKIDIETAQEYLRAHSILTQFSSCCHPQKQAQPSALFIQMMILKFNVTLHVVFESIGNGTPVYISISNRHNNNQQESMIYELFGRTYQWFEQLSTPMDLFQIQYEYPNPIIIQSKIKLLSLLINSLVYQLLARWKPMAQSWLQETLEKISLTNRWISGKFCEKDTIMGIGFSLLTSLWLVYQYQVDAICSSNHQLGAALKEEMIIMFRAASQVQSRQVPTSYQSFIRIHRKQYLLTPILLADWIGSNPSIEEEEIRMVIQIANQVELEVAMVEDLKYWERDSVERRPNGYLFWTKANGIESGKEEEYLKVCRDLGEEEWNKENGEEKEERKEGRMFRLVEVREIVRKMTRVYGGWGVNKAKL